MDCIYFKDFEPNVSLEIHSNENSTPQYEPFPLVLKRANHWLKETQNVIVTCCETIETEGVYYSENSAVEYTAFMQTLRLWYSLSDSKYGWTERWSIAYHDLVPARQESSPEAFGPKYESLSQTLDHFNSTTTKSETCSLNGSVIGVQTLTCRFTSSSYSADSSRMYWMCRAEENFHQLFYLRILYREQTQQCACTLGFRDFAPRFKPSRNTVTKNVKKLYAEMNEWSANKPELTVVNTQLVDHHFYFVMHRDHANHLNDGRLDILNKPHVEPQGPNIQFRTKILRVYYLTNDRCSLHEKLPICTKVDSQPYSSKAFFVAKIKNALNYRVSHKEPLIPERIFQAATQNLNKFLEQNCICLETVCHIETQKVVTTNSNKITANTSHTQIQTHQNSMAVFSIRLLWKQSSKTYQKATFFNRLSRHLKIRPIRNLNNYTSLAT